MKSILKQLFLLSFFTSLGFGQFLYVWNQRTHSELTWQTIETKHFQIHYHNGLDSVAIKASKIAETAYQPILDQLNLDDFGPTHITLTAEDEIMNGFAMPSNQIFIWVSQNDVAGHFGGSEKWLKMVLTHEFQHVAQFQAQKTLLGPFGQIGTPSWWIEGMAEYNTEVWRVGRADVNLKSFTYRSNIEKLEAHSDGYAKVLYLAWKYGDSTLVKISNEKVYFDKKTKKWPLSFTFEKAFKTHTGQSVREFEKEWKRVMQAYYFSVMAQKESVEEVGKTLGFRGYRSISSLSLAPDSSHWAIVGQRSKGIEIDEVWIQSTDSVKSNVLLHRGEFSSKNSWSPDSKSVLVSERHRGQYGSLIYDIRLIGLDKKIRWVSENLRGHYPIFSQDKTRFYCVGHPEGETSQIYEIDISTSKTTQITAFSGDVQLRDLCLSPDGKNIAFMIQDEDGFPDIMTFNISDKFVEKITHDRFEDLSPVWNHRGDEIIFTSYRNEIPNLFMASLSDSSDTLYQITDVAEGLWSHQYAYQILSFDNNEDAVIEFFLKEGPAGINIDNYGLLLWYPTETQLDYQRITVAISDGYNIANQSFDIYVNSLPTILDNPAPIAIINKKYSGKLAFEDKNTPNQARVSVVKGPKDLLLEENGALSWTPNEHQIGFHDIVYELKDVYTSQIDSFTLYVNSPPVITSTPNSNAKVAIPWRYTARVEDKNDNQDISFIIHNSTIPELNISRKGSITWTPSDAYLDKQTFTISVSDGIQDVLQEINLFVNSTPIIHPVTDTLAVTNVQYYATIKVTEKNADQKLIYTLSQAPSGMAISHQGVITWTPDDLESGYHEIFFAVEDGLEKVKSSFKIYVNAPPEFISLPKELTIVNEEYRYAINVQDRNREQALNVKIDRAPKGVTLVDNTLIWTPSIEYLNTQLITLSVSDGSLVETQDISLFVNALPEVYSEPKVAVISEQFYTYTLTTRDANGDTFSYKTVFLPPGATFDETTATLNWTPTPEQEGNNEVIIKITDSHNQSTLHKYNLYVFEPPEKKGFFSRMFGG